MKPETGPTTVPNARFSTPSTPTFGFQVSGFGVGHAFKPRLAYDRLMHIRGNAIKLYDRRRANLGEYGFWRDVNFGYKVKVFGHYYADKGAYLDLPPWERDRVRAFAAGLSVHEAVVMGISAARLWDLPVLSQSSVVELTLPKERSTPAKSSWPQGTVYRSARLPEDSWIQFTRMRVTTKARTVIDVARWHSFAEALTVADGFLEEGESARKLLWRELHKIGRAKGVAKARRVVEQARTRIESAAESWARAQILDSELRFSKIETQKEIRGWRVDMLIDDWLVIEVDGENKYYEYGSEYEISAKELKREKAIKNLGYDFYRVGWAALESGRFIPGLTEFIERPSRRPPKPQP